MHPLPSNAVVVSSRKRWIDILIGSLDGRHQILNDRSAVGFRIPESDDVHVPVSGSCISSPCALDRQLTAGSNFECTIHHDHDGSHELVFLV
jgi:hypothetical protein